MKTKIIYTLVSNDSDYYLEQLYISIYSFRIYHKKDTAILITDTDTYKNLNRKRKCIIKYFSEIKVIDIPAHYNNVQKSRFLRTQLRKYINGDYLFIDTDTIICENLTQIDNLSYEMAAIADSNDHLNVNHNDSWIINKSNLIGWSIINKPHFNSGVMYVKDTPRTHKFYETWHNLWLICISHGINIDQLSLIKTNEKYHYPIKEISPIWNFQIKRHSTIINQRHDIKIIHYFTSDKLSINYIFDNPITYNRIKRNADIPKDIIEHIHNPLYAFDNSHEIINLYKSQIYNTKLYHLFLYYPKIFKILENIATVYLYLRTHVGRIKYALCNK